MAIIEASASSQENSNGSESLKGKFEGEIKPGIDKYLPKLIAFAHEVLRKIESSNEAAVFIGRDGRWLFYITQLIAKQNGNHEIAGKLKFIDISRDYIYPTGDTRYPGPIEKRAAGYADYFKKLSIDPRTSFFVDVGFQGTAIRDIRSATETASDNDILLVKSDLDIDMYKGINGFYKGSARSGENGSWDENLKMGHFIEELPQIVGSVDTLIDVPGGKVPQYKHLSREEDELSTATYAYFKKSIDAHRNDASRVAA